MAGESVDCVSGITDSLRRLLRLRHHRRLSLWARARAADELVEAGEAEGFVRKKRLGVPRADAAAEVGGDRAHHVGDVAAGADELRLVALHRLDLPLDVVTDVDAE